jgi:hypothetical protein
MQTIHLAATVTIALVRAGFCHQNLALGSRPAERWSGTLCPIYANSWDATRTPWTRGMEACRRIMESTTVVNVVGPFPRPSLHRAPTKADSCPSDSSGLA